LISFTSSLGAAFDLDLYTAVTDFLGGDLDFFEVFLDFTGDWSSSESLSSESELSTNLAAKMLDL